MGQPSYTCTQHTTLYINVHYTSYSHHTPSLILPPQPYTTLRVKYAVNTETNEAVAIKILDKDKIQARNMGAQIKKEISIMKMINHHHVVGRFLYVIHQHHTPFFVYRTPCYTIHHSRYITRCKGCVRYERQDFYRAGIRRRRGVVRQDCQ
ncbi:hypothetical protein EON63_20090 [archaeon]|nr:MAG: hypothetical protein EON63_20090 [archaeon]